MEYGMFLAAVSFLTSAWLEHYIQTQPSLNSVSVAWQIPQITILTVAEILLNVTGLEFAYSQAPSNMQALILALYLFMTAIGDGFGAVLYASVFSYLSSVVAMLLCVLFMLVNLAFFSLVASRWKPYDRRRQRIHTNNEEEEGLELRHIIHLVENLH
jgi:dipeptide/tripeptide permease